MKNFFHLLVLAMLSLTTSSCGILWDMYESQQEYDAPPHSIEASSEYEMIWSISDIRVLGESDCCHSNPAMIGVSHKIIIAGADKGALFEPAITAIDSISGQILCKIPVTTSHSELVANDEILFRGTVGTLTIYAHDVENGELIWSSSLPWSHSATSIHFADNKVFVNDTNGAYSILSEQGEVLYNSNNPVGKYLDKYFEMNGILFMQNAPLGMKAIASSSEEELWVVEIDTRYAHDPVFDEGEIFTTANDDSVEIYSIDQYTGKVNWTVPHDVLSNLCVMDDKIYFTDSDSYLVAIDQNSGNELSRVQFSPAFDVDKQIGSYQIACDKANSVLAVSFGDNTQIMGLKIMKP